MRRIAALGLLASLIACSGSGGLTPPAPSSPGALGPMAETARPANGAGALPGNGAGALPGNGAGALPGALLACILKLPGNGLADCTLAINLELPPLNNPTEPVSLIPGLHPSDLQNAYNLPSQRPGTTVAIVDAYDDPTAEVELGVYRVTFGLPPCTSLNGCFRKVNQQGGGLFYPAFNLGWAQEIALDLEMVSAACPNCKILLVEANSNSMDDLGAAVDRAVAMGAKVVSNSYYASEWSGESAEDVHYRHSGVAITASSGDRPYAYYPSSSPYVTAVGGTTLTGHAGSWHEVAWDYDGHGCSVFEPHPIWQATLCKTRATTDVSAVGDPNTGVAMFGIWAGGWVVAGGTSVGTPLVAGAYALSGVYAGPEYSYEHRAGFHDLSPAGYSLPTGLGSPNGVSGF